LAQAVLSRTPSALVRPLDGGTKGGSLWLVDGGDLPFTERLKFVGHIGQLLANRSKRSFGLDLEGVAGCPPALLYELPKTRRIVLHVKDRRRLPPWGRADMKLIAEYVERAEHFEKLADGEADAVL
jgi:hypothetical protein